MAAPIVYRWDDGNAPVARGERRSLCDILYACLVTGYGDKPAAGWTREYVNATFDKAVFRGNAVTGTGLYLQVDGYGATAANLDYVQGFEAMASENDGFFPFNATRQTMATSTTANTTARPWILIADDRAFYLVVWTGITATPRNSDTSVCALFFGDIVSRFPSDPFSCGLTANSSPYGTYGILHNSISAAGALSTTGMAMPRPSSGAKSPIVPTWIFGGGPGSTNSSAAGGGGGLPYTSGAQIIITRPHINEAVEHTMRGWMPGLYYPCHNLPFNQFATITVSGVSYLSLRHHVGQHSVGNLLFSLSDWRA